MDDIEEPSGTDPTVNRFHAVIGFSLEVAMTILVKPFCRSPYS